MRGPGRALGLRGPRGRRARHRPSSVDAQAAFDTKYSLGFPLLSDPDHAVAEAYGAWGEKVNYGKTYQGIIRSSFLIDPEGRIEDAWYKVSPKDTVPKALAAMARSSLKSPSPSTP